MTTTAEHTPKKLSRFEYAINKHIHENIKPLDMDSMVCKTEDEEIIERKKNIRRQFEKIIARTLSSVEE
jgi:hypothetical protein